MRRLALFALTVSSAMALLAGCGRSQPMISAPPNSVHVSPLTLKTCATSPPQYQWIFEGACRRFKVTSAGGHFSLREYQGITVNGLIGRNNAKGTVKFALADAIDKNGDIKTYNGKAFPPYKANGTTYFYASAVNQSTQVFRPITMKGKPVLQYTVTNAKGFGDATICGFALLTSKNGNYAWKPAPATGRVMGKTVTIVQYAAPWGFELAPKIPLYFATNCYKQ